MSENEKELEREYKWLLNYVKEKISKESKISLQEKNQCHNRYLDIGSLEKSCLKSVPHVHSFAAPYDDNYVALKSPLFNAPDETNYVNASRIKFEGLKQSFIACQAPLPASFAHFWQMVLEEKVEVIVMVIVMIFMVFIR